MRFEIETWTIKKLISVHDKNKLVLNPPYQRNDIWTEKGQRELVSSIKEGMPIPNFFFHKRPSGKYDIADGQQRTRAILAYYTGEISDRNGEYFSNEDEFMEYLIPIVIIDQGVTDSEIRSFYVKVNNTGLRLNSPELTKSEYFDSKILKLVEELTELSSFKSLGIFTAKQEDRMVDREFVEELVAQMEYGLGDKKKNIKKLYDEKSEITLNEINRIKGTFKQALNICSGLAEKFDFRETRYSQRNDFYTLFGFIIRNISLRQETFNKFFSLLVKIQGDISPSNEDCKILQYYAYRCVSQSNSKNAREDRLEFFNDLLLNPVKTPNKIQRELIRYYRLKKDEMMKVETFYTIRPDKIKTMFVEE